MTTSPLASLEKLVNGPRDGALLRFSLGNEYLSQGMPSEASTHLQTAVTMDATYSAAWKLLGKALTACQRPEEALAAYETGIATAKQKGDIQAAREMTVFAKRLRKQLISAVESS